MFWLVVCVILLSLLVRKVLKYHCYWEEKGVPFEKSWPVLGEFGPVVFRTTPLSHVVLDLYKRVGEKRCSGIYQFLSPSLFLKDPDLIKEVAIRSFDHFVDHRPVISDEIDPLTGRALLALNGQEWHQMRTTLSPAFTSSKMKFMFSLITACADQLVNYLSENEDVTVEMDVKDLFTRFSNDVIASCAFGLECNSYKYKDNEFYKMVKEASDLSGLKGIKLFAYSLSPKLMTLLRVKIFPDEVSQFFRAMVLGTVKYREEHKIIRTDMIHLLIQARKGCLKHEDDDDIKLEKVFAKTKESDSKLTDSDIISQAMVFVVAGFDTSSTLMSFIAYELALNPDLQTRLREEVDDTLGISNGKITFEALSKMKYMDMVVSETLRKWPPFIFTDRKCVKDYTIEPKYPGETPIRLVQGNLLMLPIYGIQMDPKYYPNPEKFDPERFNDENRQHIIPATYIPFGIGPRNCIGLRFALMETKAVMVALLTKFEFFVTKKTQIPMKISKKHVTMTAEKGFWLGLRCRS